MAHEIDTNIPNGNFYYITISSFCGGRQFEKEC